MSTLYLTAIGLHARLVSDHLEIELPERVTPASAAHPQQRNVPLAEIERVIVGTTVSLSTPALVALLSRNVPVVFFGGKQAPAGIGMSARRNTAPLMAQLDTHRDGAARLAGARALIVAKVLNMRRVLQRMSANRERECAGASLLGDLAREAERAASLDSLRGIEGAASGCYFAVLDEFFPPRLPFERRSRRPPHNPANALLSYFYTLLCSEITALLLAHGLEPCWGFLHETDDYKPALALDLMEPYRAPLCDALVLDLFNHNRLSPDDFHTGEDGSGFYLNNDARRRVHVAWEERLEREFRSEQTKMRTTPRRTMEELCLNVRRYFTERREISPFLMN
jgi:CRISPR-associated endonuclease Cas1